MLRPTLSPSSASSRTTTPLRLDTSAPAASTCRRRFNSISSPGSTRANQLPTLLTGSTSVTAPAGASTLGKISAGSNILPAFLAAGFTSKITSYQPYSSSNYNAFVANVTRRFVNGLQANLSYTWSKTMDDATAEVFATTLTPRRPQNSQDVNADYSRSALDRTHRLSLEAVYDCKPSSTPARS